LDGDFSARGVERPFFRTYVAEIDFGYGTRGFDAHLFIRYGWQPGDDGNTLNIGLGYDFNVPRLIKETDPEF